MEFSERTVSFNSTRTSRRNFLGEFAERDETIVCVSAAAWQIASRSIVPRRQRNYSIKIRSGGGGER